MHTVLIVTTILAVTGVLLALYFRVALKLETAYYARHLERSPAWLHAMDHDPDMMAGPVPTIISVRAAANDAVPVLKTA